MPERAAAHYRTRDGTEHVVLTYRTPEGRWQVLDRANGEHARRRDAHRPRRPARPGRGARARLRRRAAGLPRRPAAREPSAQARRRRRRGAAMGGLTGALPGERAGTHAPTPNLPSTRVMRILRPQSAPSPRPRAPAVPAPPGPAGRGCGAACGSPTAACSPARCRPRATARSSSGCCTPTPPSSSSSPRAPATADGELRLDRRARPEHFLPGGAAGDPGWLAALLAHAAADRRRRLRAPARRRRRARRGVRRRRPAHAPRGDKDAVAATRFLWVDVDRPGRLHALWALLAERPCHLLIESGGSGGVHAYWKLAEPLPATRIARTRRVRRADRARAPAAHPRARRRRRRHAERRRPRAARSARA